jgi:DNA-binding transcriptional ArsR family regulator
MDFGENAMEQDKLQPLLAFFKALANESRLKIVGILANRECSVSDLADLLDLRESTVSHHLALLKELDLVRLQAEGNTHIYWLNEDALTRMNKDLFSAQSLSTLVQDVDEKSWEDKVLSNFVIDDRLTQIPARFKKRRVILRWLVQDFEFDRRYTEREVNEIIQRRHPDYASLRRYMIENKLMQRDKGIYWRVA